jgi:tetratricopeptide (TPR) repeat protein
VARIQASLGLVEEGLASAETAAAERARLFGAHSLEHARSLSTLGAALVGVGKPDEARKRFDEAIADFTTAGDGSSTEFARALSGRAQTRMLTNDIAGAREDEKRSVALFTAALGADDVETLEHQSNLAVLETESGSFAEAARILGGVLEKFERLDGHDSARVLAVVISLATALDTAGEPERALPLFERVVTGRRKIYGARHPELADALVITSLRLSRAGQQEKALAYLEEARATYEPTNHPELGSVDNYTGLVLADLGRYAEAERAFARAVTRFATNLGPNAFLGANALANEAYVVAEQGRAEEAAKTFDAAIATFRELGEFDNPRLLRMRVNWGATLRRCRRFSEARSVLEAVLALAHEKLGDQHLRVAESHVELARLDLAEDSAGAVDRARAHLAVAESIVAKTPPSPSFARSLAAAKSELAKRAG